MEIHKVKAQEIFIHNKPHGFIVEEWFYPAPGIQLCPEELIAIANSITESDEPSGLISYNEPDEPNSSSFYNWSFGEATFQVAGDDTIAIVFTDKEVEPGQIVKIKNTYWLVHSILRDGPRLEMMVIKTFRRQRVWWTFKNVTIEAFGDGELIVAKVETPRLPIVGDVLRVQGSNWRIHYSYRSGKMLRMEISKYSEE